MATPFSFSAKKYEDKTLFSAGVAAPTAGESVELRVELDNFTSVRELKDHVTRLINKMIRSGEPTKLKARN